MSFHRGRAYGQDLRERVLEARGSQCEVARRFAVSAAYVAKVRARRRDLGADTPGPQRNHVPMKLAGHEQALAAQVQAKPDQTLQALCEWAQEACGVRISISAMHKTLVRLGLTLKKSRSMPASRSEAMWLSSGRPG
jgi:transposase